MFINDLNEALNFDSSYNLNIVKNFVSHGVYGTSFYTKEGYKYYWFDPWITTGPTVLLPVSLFSFITKEFILTPRIVMNIFLFLFLFFISKLVIYYRGKLNFYQIFAANTGIFVLYSRFIVDVVKQFGIHTLGELPGYMYILIAVLGFNKENPVILGLFLALAILAKMQLIFLSLSLLLTTLVYFLFFNKQRKKAIKLLIFFFLPLFLYLFWIGFIYKSAYGENIITYFQDLQVVIKMQNGYFDVKQILLPYQRLKNLVNKYPFFVFFSFVSLFISIFKFKKLNIKARLVYISLVSFYLYFLAIWRFNSFRHIIFPQLFLVIYLFYFLIDFFSANIKTKLLSAVAISSLLFFPSLVSSPNFYNLQKQTASYLKRKYAHATFYFWGWWKSPELSLLMDKDFVLYTPKNINLCTNNCFILTSHSQLVIVPQTLDEIKQNVKVKLVDKGMYFKLYRLEE